MKAALIIIGDEILSGRVQDINTIKCAQILKTQGITLTEVDIIGDNFDEISDSLTRLTSINDLVITSGGLGPTLDDKTKEAVAKYLNCQILPSIDAKNIAINNYQRANLDFSKGHNRYEYFPEKAVALNNPKGLAPGIYHQNNFFSLACAPGVPSEFEFMLREEIIPYFLKNLKNPLKEKQSFSIRTMGLAEEKIFGEIDNLLWQDLSQYGKVSSLPQIGGVDIVVSLDSKVDLNEASKKIIKRLELSEIYPSIWQFGDRDLEAIIVKKMKEKKLTLATAESCTGGLVTNKITNISGSSQVLLGGIISYSNQCKINILGVKEATISKYGVTSKEVALEMCQQTAKINNTDYGISLTGLAGPDGGTKEQPVGTVYIGIKTPEKSECHHFVLRGDRKKLKERFAIKALFLLLKEIN